MPVRRISVSKLEPGMVIAQHVLVERGGKKWILVPSKTTVTAPGQADEEKKEKPIDELHDIFMSNGIVEVTIFVEDEFTWLDELLERDFTGKENNIVVKQNASALTKSFPTIIENNYFLRWLVRQDAVTSTIKQVMAYIQRNIHLLMAVIKLRQDYQHSYDHSIGMTILCSSLCHSLELSYDEIDHYSIGTLLCDVGMTVYSPEMISRPLGLSRKEFEQLKKHPIHTSQFLHGLGIDNEYIHTVILQHHERNDGSGYPHGLSGSEINKVVRLLAIGDVYLAMTSSRPQRQGIPPNIVIEELRKMSGEVFDREMVNYFISHVGVYPVGSLVDLSSEYAGVVYRVNRDDNLRPTILAFSKRKRTTNLSDTEKNPYFTDYIINRDEWREIDLMKHEGTHGRIRKGLDSRQYSMDTNSILLRHDRYKKK